MERKGGVGEGGVKEPLYVCVYVAEFPTQALLRHRAEEARMPVAVLSGDAAQEQVASANREALRLGVTRGMTRAELDLFPGLRVLRRSGAEERSARAALLEGAGAFTPRIEIQPSSDDVFVMVLDMTGTERIFGLAAKVMKRVAERLEAMQFVVRMAGSRNLEAAVCVAASARRGPVLLGAGREAEQIGRLPVGALRLTPKQAEMLELWGVKTVGDLAGLPEVELVVRLGQEGKRLRLLARGEHPHLMVPEEPVFALEEYVAFDAPVEALESLLFVLGPMLDQLLMRARDRSYGLASVAVTLGLEGGGEHGRTIKPALPVGEREVLLKLLHLDLEAHPPPAGVTSLQVQAEPGARSKVQLGLFAPQLPEAMRLDVTLARIGALVGEDRVGRARLVDTHRAEGFVMERFQVLAGGTRSAGAEVQSVQAVAARRCRPAVAVEMCRVGSRLEAFTLAGRQYAVMQAYGPWRRSGQWWGAEVWSREEWDVCATSGGERLLCVLAHDLLRDQWRMEALYD